MIRKPASVTLRDCKPGAPSKPCLNTDIGAHAKRQISSPSLKRPVLYYVIPTHGSIGEAAKWPHPSPPIPALPFGQAPQRAFRARNMTRLLFACVPQSHDIRWRSRIARAARKGTACLKNLQGRRMAFTAAALRPASGPRCGSAPAHIAGDRRARTGSPTRIRFRARR